MIKFLLATVLLFYFLLPAGLVSAHVLITDDTNSKGAILHIIPDDDPIAGEEAVLYFDSQNSLINQSDSVSLTVTDEAGSEQDVVTKTDGSLTTASVVFPAQGLYQIRYVVASNSNSYVFTQFQRVSRGATNSAYVSPSYNWAEMLLVGSGVAFSLLFVVGFNNKKEILRYSKIV